jgi:hypothetical protein
LAPALAILAPQPEARAGLLNWGHPALQESDFVLCVEVAAAVRAGETEEALSAKGVGLARAELAGKKMLYNMEARDGGGSEKLVREHGAWAVFNDSKGALLEKYKEQITDSLKNHVSGQGDWRAPLFPPAPPAGLGFSGKL